MIYFVQRTNGDVKIGYTSNMASRIDSLEAKYGKLKPLGYVHGGRATEKAIHERFAAFRISQNQEWFTLSPELETCLASEILSDTCHFSSSGTLAASQESAMILKLIRHRYRGSDGEPMELNTAFLRFIQENHPDLYEEGLRAADVKRQYDDIFGDDDE